jgi:Leucine-rich repeat (LRR) protein
MKLENLPVEFGKLQSLVEFDLSSCYELGCLPNSIVDLSQLKTFRLQGCKKLENLPVEFGKLQSLVELDLSFCSELGCLPDSIVDLSQLKTFQLQGCKKLKNLPVEFGKLRSLVELDLSCCSELGCLPDSIVDLSQLKTFQLQGCRKLENLPMEFGKLQSLVELDLSSCYELGCLPDSIVDLSQLKTFQLWECKKLENLPVECGKLQSMVELNLSSCSENAQFASLSVTLTNAITTYSQPFVALADPDLVTVKILEGFDNVTTQSNNLRIAVETITIFNVGERGVIIAKGFTSIIAKIAKGTTRVHSVSTGQLPDNDAKLVVQALTTFVQVHQALLQVIIGKHGLLTLAPFFEPIRLALVDLEAAIDTLAFDLIDLIPTRKPAANAQFASLSVTLTNAITTYSPILQASRIAQY